MRGDEAEDFVSAGGAGWKNGRLARVGWGALVAVVATIGYRGTQALTTSEAVPRSDCTAWHGVPFSPWWLVPYASMFVLMALPWFCLPAERLRGFGVTVLSMLVVAWLTFVFYPTACMRPGESGGGWAYQVLVRLDGPNNCLPCLHVALPFVAACALAANGGWWRGRGGRATLAGWLVFITLSTIGLRQHTGLDVATGLALGAISTWLGSWRR